MDKYSRSEKIAAQSKHAREVNAPMFAPKERCWSCGGDLWARITYEKASTRLITGCPLCNRSFVD